MLFALLFLILSITASAVFPDWSWTSVLLFSFSSVVLLRLVLARASRSGKAAAPPDRTA